MRSVMQWAIRRAGMAERRPKRKVVKQPHTPERTGHGIPYYGISKTPKCAIQPHAPERHPLETRAPNHGTERPAVSVRTLPICTAVGSLVCYLLGFVSQPGSITQIRTKSEHMGGIILLPATGLEPSGQNRGMTRSSPPPPQAATLRAPHALNRGSATPASMDPRLRAEDDARGEKAGAAAQKNKKPSGGFFALREKWCGRPDLNRQSRSRGILSPLCLRYFQ